MVLFAFRVSDVWLIPWEPGGLFPASYSWHQHLRLRPAARLQVQNSAVRLPASVFKCESTINYTLVTTMQQRSANTTLYEHKTGSRKLSPQLAFPWKDRKLIGVVPLRTWRGRGSGNRRARILEKWNRCELLVNFSKAVSGGSRAADVSALWCRRKMSSAIRLRRLWNEKMTSCASVCDRVSFVRLDMESPVAFFFSYLLPISGDCPVCLGGRAWRPRGCDGFGHTSSCMGGGEGENRRAAFTI